MHTCDAMIYNNKYVFGFHFIFGTELAKSMNLQSDQSYKGVFCLLTR